MSTEYFLKFQSDMKKKCFLGPPSSVSNAPRLSFFRLEFDHCRLMTIMCSLEHCVLLVTQGLLSIVSHPLYIVLCQ